MDKVMQTAIIIYDDYKNVLAVQKNKNKKGEPEIWSLISSPIKGKETPEKCISKAVEHDLDSILFNLEKFREYEKADEATSSIYVFSGNIRGKTILHKSLYELKWINIKELDNYKFVSDNIDIIKDFINERWV